MSAGIIDLAHWERFQERTREAWRGVVRLHGFDPDDVTFPLVIDGDTMVVTEFLRNEDGHRYMDRQRREPACRVIEVKLRTEVGIPASCRVDA